MINRGNISKYIEGFSTIKSDGISMFEYKLKEMDVGLNCVEVRGILKRLTIAYPQHADTFNNIITDIDTDYCIPDIVGSLNEFEIVLDRLGVLDIVEIIANEIQEIEEYIGSFTDKVYSFYKQYGGRRTTELIKQVEKEKEYEILHYRNPQMRDEPIVPPTSVLSNVPNIPWIG